jgi:hypothetical protein
LAVHLGFFRPGGEEYALAERYFGLATITKDHVTVTKGQLVFEYLAKGPSSMSRSWQGSRLIEEEIAAAGTARYGEGRCVTSTGAGCGTCSRYAGGADEVRQCRERPYRVRR